MRKLAIVLLSFGVIAGYGSAFASMHRMHHGCGYSEGGRWVPGHWESDAERSALDRAAAPIVVTPAPVVAPAPAPAPYVAPPPQIIVVQPQAAPAAPPTIVVQPPTPAATPKTEPAKVPITE
jgi:hypothetical protein